MRKILVPLLAILLFNTCKKHDPETKIQVCHQDQKEGTSHTITISANALPAHLAHGDLPGACPIVTTTICDQTWIVKNLDVDHYRNGDPIPQVTDPTEWTALTTGAWCYYDNASTNGTIYGKLYNWYAVNDPRGLAPEGWHVPSEAECEMLSSCLGGDAVAGGAMKSVGTVEDGTGLWYAPNADATNSSGFTGHPGGIRFFGNFGIIGEAGFWWSSTAANESTFKFSTAVDVNERALFQEIIVASLGTGIEVKHCGLSVRCLKD